MSDPFNLVPGRLNINAVSGDDFAVLLDFNVDLTGYTFEARILLDNQPSNRYQAITVTNTNLADGRITLSLSDAQTQALGPLSNRKWFITWSQGGDIRTVLSGTFTLNSKWAVTDYSPTTENQTIVIETPTVSVEVIGGVGGAVIWGDIQGDIQDQTDLIEYLQTNYAPANATFIVQNPSASLSSEQALSDLATGLLKNTTTTGVLSIAVAGSDYIQPAALNSVVYINNGSGVQTTLVYSSLLTGESIVARNSSGRFQSFSPSASLDVANKSYVDGIVGTTSGVMVANGSGVVSGISTSTANQYLRRNADNSGYEFGNKTEYFDNVPNNEGLFAFSDIPTDQIVRLNPGSDLSELAIAFPTNSSSIPGQKIIIMCTKNIATLLLSGPTTIFNAPVSMNAGDCFQFYKTASNEWARVIT